MHIMIDFETLGYAYNGKVTYVAYSAFDITKKQSIEELMGSVREHKLNWKSQDQYHIDNTMLDFWKRQPKDILTKMIGSPDDGLTLPEFCDAFSDYFFEIGFNAKDDIIWSRGTSFDITILDRLYTDYNKPKPYNFWRARDARTFIDAVNITANNINKDMSNWIGKFPDVISSSHDASHDVAKDIHQLQLAYSSLLVNRIPF